MSAVTTRPRLAELASRRLLRRRIETAVSRLIEALDALDGDADGEPNLGSPEINATCSAIMYVPGDGWRSVRVDQEQWAKGANDDREVVDEDGTDLDQGEHDPCDLEPSLGAAENHEDQRGWVAGNRDDREDDGDAEPDDRRLPRE